MAAHSRQKGVEAKMRLPGIEIATVEAFHHTNRPTRALKGIKLPFMSLEEQKKALPPQDTDAT